VCFESVKYIVLSQLLYNGMYLSSFLFCRSLFVVFSSPCLWQGELLPSLGVRRLSSVNFSHQVSDAGSVEPLVVLAITLSVLRFTSSDYLFAIFNLFLKQFRHTCTIFVPLLMWINKQLTKNYKTSTTERNI
jgi:hypothetical protein